MTARPLPADLVGRGELAARAAQRRLGSSDGVGGGRDGRCARDRARGGGAAAGRRGRGRGAGRGAAGRAGREPAGARDDRRETCGGATTSRPRWTGPSSGFGGVDVVVAVAGVGALAPLLELGDESWRRVIDINLTGVFLTVQEGARAMVASGRAGAIVVVSSTNAVFAEESTVHYTASKGALVALVRAASLDLARHGIRINAVAPGMVRTRMAAPLTDDAPPPATSCARPARPLRRAGGHRGGRALPRLGGVGATSRGSLVVADGGLTAGMTLGHRRDRGRSPHEGLSPACHL